MSETHDVKIVAIMSCPTVGWNPHWGCVSEALYRFGIPIRLAFGAYWHQGISNLFEDCIAEGIDWVLTIDYDTMFSAKHLDALIGRFGQNPDMDALSALQCKRGTDEIPLFTIDRVKEVELQGQAVKVDTMHFGLTLFRLDAFKNMALPWFQGVPDKSGSYHSADKVDADIYFWRKWKQAGNTAYTDPYVNVGHLQPMVAVFDEEFKVKHMHVVDWRKENRP